jgi:phytanoyl-CoA hydroxylase
MAVSVGLTEAQLDGARSAGYVLLEDILSRAECDEYAQRLDDYARGRRPLPEGMAIQREPRVERGEAVARPGEDVRKISGVARGDQLFRRLVLHPRIVAVMQQLMGPNLKLFRADVLMKPAGVGSAKGVHQDSPYWPIEPMELWSCWMPFDPATVENGCMEVIPGSQAGGALPHVRVTDDYVIPPERYDPGALVSVPMSPGSGLFFHSLLIHGTAPNTSPRPRRAITMSYMAAAYRYTGQSPPPEYLRISGVDVPGGV